MKQLSKPATATFALFLVASCSSEPDFEQMSDVEFLQWQAINEYGLADDHPTVKALEDGYASVDEYEQAWATELACIEGLGYEIGQITTSKLNGWAHQVMLVPPAEFGPDFMPKFDACHDENRSLISLLRKHVSPHEDRIDPPLLADAQTCLNGLDTPPNGTEVNVHELLDTTNDPAGTMDCLLDSWSKLYPDDQRWHGVDVGDRP